MWLVKVYWKHNGEYVKTKTFDVFDFAQRYSDITNTSTTLIATNPRRVKNTLEILD